MIRTIGTIALVLLTLANVEFSRRMRERERRLRFLFHRTAIMRDEITLTIVENDNLRREGVWQNPDDGVWYARTTITANGASADQAHAALSFAVFMTAKNWPHRGVRTH